METGYPSPSMGEPPQNNRKFMFIALFLVVIIMFLATIAYLISHVSKNSTTTATGTSQQNNETSSGTTNNSQKKAAQSSPQVKFAKWIEPTNHPTSVTTATTYNFKQNYTSTEISALAKNLGAGKVVKPDANLAVAYTKNSDSAIAALKFNTKTGSFSYLNTTGLPLTTGSTTEEKIYNLLRSLNWYDPTIKVTAHYQKSDQPGVVFYELHRDWSAAGLPILNFNGLFNVDENQPLSTLKLATNANLPSDKNIIAASDGKNGFKRADDFNTMTIAVSSDSSRILSMNSNLRQLVLNNQSATSLLTYDEVLQKLKNNQYQYIFTSPSGTGQISWEKIYPKNIASANQAITSEASYAYLEQFPSEVQTQLRPYVLFRGSAALDSGYSVNFIAAVDATRNTTAMSNSKVLGASTFLAQRAAQIPEDDRHGEQLDKIANPPTTPEATPNPDVKECQPKATDLHPTLDWPYKDSQGVDQTLRLGYGKYQRIDDVDKGSQTRDEYRWYYLPSDATRALSVDKQEKVLDDVFHVFLNSFDEIAKQAKALGNIDETSLYCSESRDPAKIEQCLRDWKLLFDDFNRYQGYYGQACPLIFTGLSPAIFVYGPENTNLDIRSWATLTYADPSTEDSMWHVKIGAQNILTVNGSSKPYIYYEYSPVVFNRPQLGWNVTKANLNTFVNQISKQLKLTTAETTRLQYEVQNAAGNLNSSDLFIGLIDQQELNSKLPLSINPSPQSVQRYHFYIGKSTVKDVRAPQLSPVERKPFMVVELGAVSGK